MDDCFICFESPCQCETAVTKSAKPSTRAPRRSSSPAATERRKVARFSSASIEKPAPPPPVVTTQVQTEVREGETSEQVDRSEEEIVRILAPLLADRELEPYQDYLPADCKLTLDERRRKFRDGIKWSEGRYDV